jgi:phosphatidylglycerophosphate synthase
MPAGLTRRPIRARDSRWAAATACWLARIGLRPNQISVLSVLFGVGAGAMFILAGIMQSPMARAAAFVVAAIGIQLRLLCNLFDGMVAVEGGHRTKSGEMYNELPDRFSDAVILAGAGYSFLDLTWLPALGWSAAVLAVMTAYVRALGAAAGAEQYFLGPMAKPHRMAVMTIAALASPAGEFFSVRGLIIAVALGIIVVGCILTIGRRCRRIIRELESR